MLNFKKYSKHSSVLISALLSLGVTHSAISLELAQQPLFLQTSADPNILFILDDSGSMQFEVTPGEHTGLFSKTKPVYYSYPQTETSEKDGSLNVTFEPCIYNDNTPSGCGYWNGNNDKQVVPLFDSDNKWAAFFRSAHNNKSYYNPQVQYTPWAEQDGTPWPNATITRAYHNPGKEDKGWRNLTVENTQSAKCWIEKKVILQLTFVKMEEKNFSQQPTLIIMVTLTVTMSITPGITLR